jgi:hypothetical protein
MNTEVTKQYIGDSVYADFDGYHIVLTTENGLGASNTVYLEYGVFMQLMEYGKRQFNLGGKGGGATAKGHSKTNSRGK